MKSMATPSDKPSKASAHRQDFCVLVWTWYLALVFLTLSLSSNFSIVKISPKRKFQKRSFVQKNGKKVWERLREEAFSSEWAEAKNNEHNSQSSCPCRNQMLLHFHYLKSWQILAVLIGSLVSFLEQLSPLFFVFKFVFWSAYFSSIFIALEAVACVLAMLFSTSVTIF